MENHLYSFISKALVLEKLCDNDIIIDLIMDEHGNYVVQKVLSSCFEEKKKNYWI